MAKKKVSINSRQMFPHELANVYFQQNEIDPVVELQWKGLVEELRQSILKQILFFFPSFSILKILV